MKLRLVFFYGCLSTCVFLSFKVNSGILHIPKYGPFLTGFPINYYRVV